MDPRHDDIERYLTNQMTDAERHALEKRALTDPFLADAIEGAQIVKPEEFLSDANALRHGILAPRKVWKFSLRIAAGVFLAIALGWLIWKPVSPPQPPTPLAESSSPAAADSMNRMADEAKPAADTKETVATAKPNADSKDQATKELQPDHVAATEPSPARSAAVAETEDALDAVAESRKAAPAPSMKKLGQPSRVITGKVTEAEDDIPLANVVVRDAQSQQETRTRGDGTYSLPVTAESPTVQYSFPGLQSVEQLAGNETRLNVQLNDDSEQQSEIIAFPPSNWSSSVPEELQLAAPSGGIQAYQKYLETNRRFPASAQAAHVSGKVTLAFTVDPAGIVNDIRLVKGLGYGCDEETIRLVKMGPSWIPARYGNAAVPSSVWVKLEFRADR